MAELMKASNVEVTEHVVRHAKIKLTRAEILALDNWTEIIPAPGEGKFIEMLLVTTVSKQGSVDYGAQPIKLTYENASGQSAANDLHWGVLNCSHDKVTLGYEEPELELDNGFDTFVNKAVGIFVDNPPTPEGDGEITLFVTYTEHTIA